MRRLAGPARRLAGPVRRLSAPTVVVAGLGRCGTTLMVNTIGRGMDALYHPYALFWENSEAAIFTGISEFFAERKGDPSRRSLPTFGSISQAAKTKRGYVYKTHSYPFPDIPLPRRVRIIWMFGNPMTIAASTNNMQASQGMMQKEKGNMYHNMNSNQAMQKKIWNIHHYRHLESPHYQEYDEILTRDTCLLERHFDAWYRPHAFPFLSVRYESLREPQVQQAVADFVGLPLRFRPWKPRATDWQSHPRRAELEATYGRLHAKVEAAEDTKIWQAEKVRPEWQEH